MEALFVALGLCASLYLAARFVRLRGGQLRPSPAPICLPSVGWLQLETPFGLVEQPGRMKLGKDAGWRQKLYSAIEPFEDYLDDRLIIVSGLFLLSLLTLDVVLWKACVIAIAAYICLIIPIGQHAVEAVCILLFAAAMARWADIDAHSSLIKFARTLAAGFAP